jgi:N-acetylglutamate synthase-like GNAT family acetyltransferase
LAALIVAAQHYERDVTIAAVEVVELLTDDDGLARWRSVESIALVAPRVIGRGGLEARIVRREHGGLLECLAVRDGEQIGAAHLWLPSARLLDVTVAPVARREGAARHLLIAVEQAAREAGCESLVADAHPFLEHHGWHADAGGQCRRWLGQL